MGAGGIIQQRAAAVLVTLTDPSWYQSLDADDKSTVDGINAMAPMSRTQEDLDALLEVLSNTNSSG